MTPTSEALARSHAARTQNATERAVKAIRDMDNRGEEISFSAVARTANVGRAFLYSSAEIRGEIEKLRAKTIGRREGPSSAERATEESLRGLLRASKDDNRRLRAELSALREELALAHGEVRDLKARKRTTNS